MILAFATSVWLNEPEIAIFIVPIALGASVNRQYQNRKKEEAKAAEKPAEPKTNPTPENLAKDLLGG